VKLASSQEENIISPEPSPQLITPLYPAILAVGMVTGFVSGIAQVILKCRSPLELEELLELESIEELELLEELEDITRLSYYLFRLHL
jgi:hypothetical protein